MSDRKPCKECPWTTDAGKSADWREYIRTAKDNGTLKELTHRCHMIDSATFDDSGSTVVTPCDNLCIGSVHAETLSKII